MITAADIHAGSAERDSVCHLLQLGDYRADLGGWTRVDGAHTILCEVVPCAALDQPDAVLVAQAESLSQGLAGVRTGTIVHATFWLSRRIDQAISAYQRMGGDGTPILRTLEQARVDLLRGGAEAPLLTFGGARAPFGSRTLRLVMGLTVLPEGDERATLLDHLVAALSPGRPARRRAEQVRQALAKRGRDQWLTISGKLALIGCQVIPLESADAIGIARELLYPRSGWKAARDHDDWLPDYLRMPLSEVVTDRAQGTVEADGAVLRCATLRGNPVATSPGSLSLPHAALGAHSLLDFLDQGFITINAVARDKEATRFVLQQLLLNVEGGMGMPGRQEEAHAQATRALGWIESENRRMFDVEMVAVAWDDSPARAEDRIRQLAERLGEVSARFQVEVHAGPSFIFRALPGGAQPPIAGAQRDIMLCDRQIADLLPVFYRGRGTAEAVSLFHGTGGEPLPFSLWGGASQGFLVAGRTGQGKTFLCQALLYDILRAPGSQAIVIDKGDSYLAMTMSFRDQGLYKRLGRGGTRCTINILGGTYDQVAPVALSFLGLLCARPGTEPLGEAHIGFLARALERIFAERSSTIAYVRDDDLRQGHSGAVHVARARKRLAAAFVGEGTGKLLASLARSDSEIRILYRYELIALRVPAPGRPEQVEVVRDIRDRNHIPTEIDAQLRRAMGFEIISEEGVEGGACVLLHPSPDEAELLRGKGIEAALDRTRCLIELASEEDVACCERARIVFLVGEEVMQRATARLQEEVESDPAHAQASPAAKAQAVRRRLKAVGGIEVFRATYGTATIQREVTLGDLGRHLEDLALDASDRHAGELQARLAPYYGTGAYSAFFDGASNLPLAGAKLTDVELGQLAEQVDEHTFACIFTALIHHLTRYLLDPANRGRRKVLLIEEAWQYLKDNRLQPGCATVVGEALSALLRTARKHGVAIGLVTQNVTDLTATAAGPGDPAQPPDPDPAAPERGGARWRGRGAQADARGGHDALGGAQRAQALLPGPAARAGAFAPAVRDRGPHPPSGAVLAVHHPPGGRHLPRGGDRAHPAGVGHLRQRGAPACGGRVRAAPSPRLPAMSAAAPTLGGSAAAAGRPARWFRHALQAPPQAVPDNLHGILAGGARGRLRALAVALRRAAGPVLVLASDDAAHGPPPGIPIRDLDLCGGAAARHGGRPWRPWAAGLAVVTAAPCDAERTALVLASALTEAQARQRRGDAAVRTLVIDSDLLGGAAQEVGENIARCGRKANCSGLVLAGSADVPGWRDHAGFTIAEEGGRLWLATDQDYRIAIDAVVDGAWLVRAHALLHRLQRAD